MRGGSAVVHGLAGGARRRCSSARASPAMIGVLDLARDRLTASKSPGEVIGKPASMMSTPSRSSWCAISILSRGVQATPGDCSPSRRVVSKMLTRLSGSRSRVPCSSALTVGSFLNEGASRTRCPAHPDVGVGKLPLAGEEPDEGPGGRAAARAGCAASTSMAAGYRRRPGRANPRRRELDGRAPLGEPRPRDGVPDHLARRARRGPAGRGPRRAGARAARLGPAHGHRPPGGEQPEGRAGDRQLRRRPPNGLERQVNATDPEIADGRGVVRVNATGITSGATPRPAPGSRRG